jgi:hypothetical protein
VVARILGGFEAKVLAHDPRENPAVTALGGRYVPLETLLAEAEIVTLHCPLTPATRHLIRNDRLALMRDGALLVNTGRGALIDAKDVVDALKSGSWVASRWTSTRRKTSCSARSLREIIADDIFARLLTFRTSSSRATRRISRRRPCARSPRRPSTTCGGGRGVSRRCARSAPDRTRWLLTQPSQC